MSTADRLDETIAAAKAEGVLPQNAVRPVHDTRPWPVVLLTGLGAWLAAVPLIAVVAMLLGGVVARSFGPYVIGLAALTGAVVVMRSRDLPVFVEQLAVPAFLVGGGALVYGLFRDLPSQLASVAMVAVAGAVALAVPQAWMRVLLGAACAIFGGITLVPFQFFNAEYAPINVLWTALHGLLAVWLVMLGAQREWLGGGARAACAGALESFAAGWLLALLAGLCWLAGTTFLVGGSLGGNLAGELAREFGARRGPGINIVTQAVSAALALLGAAWCGRRLPTLRNPLAACVAVVLAALAWFMPSLGAACLALALMAGTQRWRLATAAAFAAAWILGSFYYQLAWPLAHKAAVLAFAGALLGMLAWLARRQDATRSTPSAAQPRTGNGSHAAAFIAVAAVATLAVANFAIWQKQDLIANGRPVFVELAPIDPRSLMQGDYMRLNYRLPDNTSRALDPLAGLGRPHVVAKTDARGAATLLRIEEAGEGLAPGEFRIELTPKAGRWMLVSDAWFFREGESERWVAAKYGEFRVLPDGRALLVGLADAELRRIEP